jgi:hypothetical protein
MSWWRFFARRRRDLDEEIEAHLRMAVRDRVERGENPVEARAAAAKEFGNVLLVKDVTRESWGGEWLESAVQDLKYALRRLVKSPGFTIAAIATLSLGIGANTAIFELLDAVLLQSLPVANPQELAEVRIVAMIGLYGVMSYTVAERTSEIGIRMALGARRADVTAMILRKAATLLAAGLAVGVGLSLAAGSAASALIFGLKPRDPVTLAIAVAVLGAVALGASYLPARRAAALDPIASLKDE